MKPKRISGERVRRRHTGATGARQVLPRSPRGRRKGCLDWTMCSDTGLKGRVRDAPLSTCLAGSPANACSVEGATKLVLQRCAQQVISHACADPAATQTRCQRVARDVPVARARSMQTSCAAYVTPMTAAGRNAFVSCMVEGCEDYQFRACTLYAR